MTRRNVQGRAFAIITMVAGLAAATPVRASEDEVAHLLTTAQDACRDLGDKPALLNKLAAERRWTPAAAAERQRSQTAYTTMLGGWTFSIGSSAFAVIQSEMRPPAKGHVCSVTTKLLTDSSHGRLKAAFAKTFATEITEEADSPVAHTDRYWISRGAGRDIRASVVFDRTNGVATVRMIHGADAAFGS